MNSENRLSSMFVKKGLKFMPYVCFGDPSEEFSLALVKTLVSNGADAIEFGIPFSDPYADGKTLQAASARALASGMTPKKAILAIEKLRNEGVEVPIIVMTYYNIVYAYEGGVAGFLSAIKRAGADGIIVPDAPLDECEELRNGCAGNGLDLVLLITPNCSDERLMKISGKASGFLYAVAVFGATGARESVDARAIELVKRAKKISKLPVVAGFGISKPEHAREFERAGADGVIIGSGIANVYSKFIGKDGKIDVGKALFAVGEYSCEFNFSREKGE